MPQKCTISFSVYELQKTIIWGRKTGKQHFRYPPTSKLHEVLLLAIWFSENNYICCENY